MTEERPILTPRPLRHGDRVAIVSPAGIIKPQVVYNSLPVLADCGWVPYVGKNTFGRFGTFAGTDDERYADLEAALLDPDTRAIICSRGGYGAVHLHALMTRHGIKSVHAPMTKHISENRGRDTDSRRLFEILSGATPDLRAGGHPLNRPGEAEGLLVGGNLAVIAGLLSTPFDVIRPGRILFIEDIAVPIYKVERILYTLRLSGVLGQLAGLVVGRFTDYAPDRGSASMEEMISRIVADYSYPVAYGIPVGHVDHNVPLVCSSLVRLEVTRNSAVITPIG